MKIKEITLSELCLQSLIRNKDKFQIIANIPYRLINKYLKRININAIQLLKYERFNIEWIFDDDELWLDFLQVDFPTNVHEKYVSNKDTIVKYYKDAIRSIYYDNENKNENDFLIKLILKNRISDTIKRDASTKKYKVPYRMLYLQYQEDIKLKEAKITENLRLQVQKIKEEREKKSAVIVGEQFYIENTVGRNRSYRKRHLIDRMYIASTKKMNLQSGTKQKMENRKPVERVAFGGMAGKKIDPKLFKTIYRDPSVDDMNQDNIKKGQETDKNSCMTASIRNSNTANTTTSSSISTTVISSTNLTSTNKTHMPIRKQRNGLEQNIFLKKKRPMSRLTTSSLTKSTPISNILHDKNATTANGGGGGIATNIVTDNKNVAIILGTRRKQSNIFKSPVHPNTQPHPCDFLKTDSRVSRLKDDDRKKNEIQTISKQTCRTDTPTIDKQDNSEKGRPNDESGKKRKIYSLKTYLQKKK